MKRLFQVDGISLFILVILLQACNNKKQEVKPSYQSIVEAVYASANVKALNQYEVVSPVSGIVRKILVKEGDSVVAGQVLIEIENYNQQFNLENALLAKNTAMKNMQNLEELEAQLSTARIQVEQDSLNLKRQEELWENHVGTKNAVETRKLQYNASKNTLKALSVKYNATKLQLETAAMQAENNLKIARELKEDFEVRSAVNGRVYNLTVAEGDLVSPQKSLALLGDASSFILQMEIDEVDISKIETGQSVMLEMDAFSNQIFEAKVTRILPNLNTRSQTFIAEAVFTKKPPVLYPGLSAEANIVISQKEKAMVIPVQYISNSNVVHTSKGEKVVKTGIRSIGMIEVISGLDSSDVLMMPE